MEKRKRRKADQVRCLPPPIIVPTMLLSLAWSGAALLAMVAVGLALEEAASRQLLFLHLVPIGPSPFAADLNLNEPVLRCASRCMQRALPSTRLASSARRIGCRTLARRAPASATLPPCAATCAAATVPSADDRRGATAGRSASTVGCQSLSRCSTCTSCC